MTLLKPVDIPSYPTGALERSAVATWWDVYDACVKILDDCVGDDEPIGWRSVKGKSLGVFFMPVHSPLKYAISMTGTLTLGNASVLGGGSVISQ